MTPASSGQVVFGDFELELATGDLKRRGRPVKLAAQPAKVLGLLVTRPGELVPRAEIQRHVWGDTVVEQDQGLNACVRQVRAALGDRPEPPIFIETVPRRGYRFIAPVTTTSAVVVAREAEPSVAPARPLPLRRRTVIQISAAALAAVLLAVAAWRTPSAPPVDLPAPVTSSERVMLAVLPIESLSDDPEDASFAHGLTEELITELARLGPERLGVISRTSALRYRDQRPSLRELGFELGVGYVLEGSVRRADGVVRIVIQLVRVSDQSHLWAERFDRSLVRVLDVQLDVARRVASSLAPELLDRPIRQAVNPEAREAYLRGRYRLQQREPVQTEKAIEDFQRALELDPSMAEAFLGLSDAYHTVGWPGAPSRREAIESALAIDPDLAEAHLRLGRLRLYVDWDFEGAGQSFARAVRLEPGDAATHQAYALYLSILRRHDEAIDHLEQARQLDPVSVSVHGDGGMIYFSARRYEKAVELCRRTLELSPDHLGGLTCLLDAYRKLGRHQQALEQAKALMRMSDASEESRRQVAEAPDSAEAWRVFYEWQSSWLQEQQAPAISIAAAVLPLGRVDEVFAWLEKAFEQKSPGMLFLAADPRADQFRGDPRYVDLLRRVGFPSATIDG